MFMARVLVAVLPARLLVFLVAGLLTGLVVVASLGVVPVLVHGPGLVAVLPARLLVFLVAGLLIGLVVVAGLWVVSVLAAWRPIGCRSGRPTGCFADHPFWCSGCCLSPASRGFCAFGPCGDDAILVCPLHLVRCVVGGGFPGGCWAACGFDGPGFSIGRTLAGPCRLGVSRARIRLIGVLSCLTPVCRVARGRVGAVAPASCLDCPDWPDSACSVPV